MSKLNHALKSADPPHTLTGGSQTPFSAKTHKYYSHESNVKRSVCRARLF